MRNKGEVMRNFINKYKITILWTVGLTLLLGGIGFSNMVQRLSAKSSAIIIFFSFSSMLLAMLISAIEKKDKTKIIVCIGAMGYFIVRTFLRFF